MSDEQVESLAQQLLTVIGDSRTADGVTVTLDAAMRDEGRILLTFTVEGDSKLTPSAGRLEREKSGMYPYLTKEELKKLCRMSAIKRSKNIWPDIKKLKENGDDFLKGSLELTAFEGEDGSQHMLMQLDTSSNVEIFDVHLEEFGGIPGPFDFHVTVPEKGEPLVYSGSIPFTAAGGIEMTLTEITVRPMSGVSAELTLSDSAGTLPENDQKFNESITVDMVRWNGMEAGNSSDTRTHRGKYCRDDHEGLCRKGHYAGRCHSGKNRQSVGRTGSDDACRRQWRGEINKTEALDIASLREYSAV